MGIEARGLSRYFGDRRIYWLEHLEIPDASLVLLRGPNGSGKTTFLRTLATLITPTTGDVKIGGFSLIHDAVDVRRQMGFAPATDGGFFKRLTGHENLQLFGGLRGMSVKEIDRSIDRWREIFSLDSILRTRFGAASAGMKQHLSILRALLHDPQLLLLDEPDRSLDSEAQKHLRKSIRDLAHVKTVIVTTHYDQLWPEPDANYMIQDGLITQQATGFA